MLQNASSEIVSSCCYKTVDQPSPGSWVSINTSQSSSSSKQPFCVEPDLIRSRIGGWTPSSTLPPPQSTSSSSSSFSTERCDMFPPPSAALNITSIALDEWLAWRHQESNDSIISTILATQGISHGDDNDEKALRDEDYRLFNRMGNFFGRITSAMSSSSSSKFCSNVMLMLVSLGFVLGCLFCGAIPHRSRAMTPQNPQEGYRGPKPYEDGWVLPTTVSCRVRTFLSPINR